MPGIWLPVLLATVLGVAIGLERELSAQPAGLRTHVLVCLGAMLFTLVGARAAHADPTRIAAQVVAGIGFLGGGTILRDGFNVRGLTTAASLWVTAAAGLAVGLRSYAAACSVIALSLVVLVGLKLIERKQLPRRRGLRICLELDGSRPITAVHEAARAVFARATVIDVALTSATERMVLRGRPYKNIRLPEVAEAARLIDGVAAVEISQYP
jgi:putative Mg2+ transporter-C (MgtC) family protein